MEKKVMLLVGGRKSLRIYIYALFVFLAGGILLFRTQTSVAVAATETSEQKIWRALTNLEQARSYTYEGSASVAGYMDSAYTPYVQLVSGDTAKPANKFEVLTFNFKGGNEVFTRLESQSWFSFALKSSDKNAPAFGIETRSVGGNTYVSLSNATHVPLGLESYKNVWVQFNIKSILAELGLTGLLEKSYVQTGFISGQDKQALNLALKSGVLKATKRAVKKSGAATYDVYTVVVNKNNVKKLMVDLSKTIYNETPTAAEIKSLDKELAEIKSMSGEVWISRDKTYPYRLTLQVVGTKPKETTSVTVTFKNINQSISVLEPASYVTVEQLFNQLFPQLESVTNKTSSFNF